MKEKATIYDYARMCRKYAILDCCHCPLSRGNNGLNEACDDFMRAFTDKTNEIILNWVKEHPVKTRQSEFLKIFSNAKIEADGVSSICPRLVNKDFLCQASKKHCSDCCKNYWLEEVDENE